MSKGDNKESYTKFRKEYPIFIYNSFHYSFSGNKINFGFEFITDQNIIFRPFSSISVSNIPQNREIVLPLIENIIFQIGMIELISYWKATCSPTIIIKAGTLSETQVEWWKNLYYKGLGEFFYLNSIDVNYADFVNIVSEGKHYYRDDSNNFLDEYIVPIGGGKDSAVTLELLMRGVKKVHPLIMNPRGATLKTVIAGGLQTDDVIIIDRTIDPLLLKLNGRGFLNGHTPFSAMLAFYTLLASAFTGYKHIALSNESSANEATIPGTDINHQYSKSVEFEQNFRQYTAEYINNNMNYFSFLRPFNELQIVSVFAGLDKYHQVFKSCNVGSKTDSWCGSCPKCLFTHIMLSAFKGIKYADNIIGQPMLTNQHNIKYFDELTGFSAIKPFECVGTLLDVQTAMLMIVKNENNSDDENSDSSPLLVKRFKHKFKQGVHLIDDDINSTNLHSPDKTEHFLNKEQLSILLEGLNLNTTGNLS